MTDRNKRLLLKAMQAESTWLQKALFALARAEDARSQAAEITGDSPTELRAPARGKWASLSDFQSALEDRVSTIMDDLQEKRRVAS